MQDRKLFSKIKEKNKDAFMQFYDLYVNDIHRFVYFKVGKAEDANDLTSTVFLKAWKHVLKNDLDEEKSLRALVYKIARNTIIDHYRRASSGDVSLDQETEEGKKLDIIDDTQHSDKNLELSLNIEKIKEALPRLKDEYRELIIMRFVNQLSFSEISHIIEKSKGNARVLTFRAIKALKDIINER